MFYRYHSHGQLIKGKSTKPFIDQNFQVKSISIGIGINNTGPVLAWYWIDTKICSIAHPYCKVTSNLSYQMHVVEWKY